MRLTAKCLLGRRKTAAVATQHSPYLELPAEIHNHIGELVLTQNEPSKSSQAVA